MTRKEEIRNASVDYNEKVGKLLVMGGDNILSEEEYLEFNKNPSFIAGAEWADRTMIDRVCEWLKENAYFSVNEYTGSINEEKLVNDLRKVMEE